MRIAGVGGASCAVCPPGGREWRVDIEAGGLKTFSFTLEALTPAQPSLIAVPVSVTIGQWGLPVAPTPPVRAALVNAGSFFASQCASPAELDMGIGLI